MAYVERKALSMQIKGHGASTETTATLVALARVPDIHYLGRPYPNRPPSAHHRIHLHATPRESALAHAYEARCIYRPGVYAF
uniref:Uncharacterized protein n=1 Tax=Salinispora arenicola (strain CNS-205) TaxID=391037 RepID=A8M693_SALAI